MKKIIISLLLSIPFQAVLAQDFTDNKFRSMTLNNISMAELFTRDIDWTFFRSKVGTPTSESVTNHDGEYNTKEFVYSGAHFTFSDYLDKYDLNKVEITSGNYTITYDGLQIKVGNSLSTLSPKFPQAYSERADGRIHIHHAFAEIVMSLYYNSSGVITKLELWQSTL